MYHRTELIGNLGKDPEMRYTANGNAVVSFSVAVNETWNGSDGEKQQRTEWYSVIAWSRLAEICAQYITKGSLVFVSGRMQTRSWDGNDGVKHYRTELIANEVKFLDRKGDGQRSFAGGDQYDRPPQGHLADEAMRQGATRAPGADGDGDIDPDDLPF